MRKEEQEAGSAADTHEMLEGHTVSRGAHSTLVPTTEAEFCRLDDLNFVELPRLNLDFGLPRIVRCGMEGATDNDEEGGRRRKE